MLCAIQRLPFPESLCRVFQALFHSFQRQSTYHGFRLSHVIWGPMADEIVFLAIGAFVGGAVFGLFTASPMEWIMQLRNLDEGSSRSVANEER